MLKKVRWLDPRVDMGEPIADSVWIPFTELADRAFELPSKRIPVEIAAVGDDAERAKVWLESAGREAVIRPDFQLGLAGRGRLWSPNAFLERVIPLIARGTALDIACGSGRDAVFLADQGFSVTGVDHLPDALVLGRRLADRYLDDASCVRWIRANLDALPSGLAYDLVTCFFYLNRELLSRLPLMVKPGGSFVMETFTTVHRETFGKPRSERLVLQPGELRELLGDFAIKEYAEGWHGDRHTARILAINSNMQEMNLEKE